MAVQELLLGHSDLVITGSAGMQRNDPFMFMCFSKTPALSLTAIVAHLLESADGTMLGENYWHAGFAPPGGCRKRWG